MIYLKKWYEPDLCWLAKDHLLVFTGARGPSKKGGVELAYTVCAYKESWRRVKASRKSFKRKGVSKCRS